MSDRDYIPDEDFEEVNKEGTLSEDDEEGTVSYVTKDDEAMEEEEVASPSRKEIAKKEKQRLREIERLRKERLDSLRKEQNTTTQQGQVSRDTNRFRYLVQQAEIFQHFVPSVAKPERPKKCGSKEMLAHVGGGMGCRSHGRLDGKFTEDMEDNILLQDEEEDGEAAGHRLAVQPACIVGGKMRDYQMQGLNWLIHLYDNGINGILADEMGLGKTLQTIALLAYLYEFRTIRGPHLIIVPKSTLHNWMNEFRNWCPTLRPVKFHGNEEERTRQFREEVVPGKFDVCVTSYEMVIKEKTNFKKFHWRYVVIDEAHRIKNENSLLAKVLPLCRWLQVVRTLRTNYRLLITGTPLQNNLHELWALLNFLLPEIFSSSEKFEEWFALGEGGQEKEAEVVQQLHKVLRPFLLRRVKSDVERGLPPKKETILKIGMSEMQRKYYAALLQKDIEAIGGGAERSRLLNIVMQLRKCCNHPYLFQGAEPGPPYTTGTPFLYKVVSDEDLGLGEHLVETSGKMVLIDKLLPKLRMRGSRVLIFSQMTRLLDILEDYCLYREYRYCRIDGNTSGDDREYAIDEFNREGSETFIFLLSTRAGGLGINLATADIVILFDSDWNPQMDLQAMDRAHRIGQKKEVQVFRLCIENSIEEKVIEKAYKKLRLDAMVIQQGRLTENRNTKVNKDDLLNMVRYGAELVFSSGARNITDADINTIIQKGEKDTKELNDKMQHFTENAVKFTLDGGISLYDYKEEEHVPAPAGMDLKAIISNNWVDPPKRERRRVLNYSETEYYKQALKTGKAERPPGPRLPKMPHLQDFQFFDISRLTELFEKENNYELWKHQQTAKDEPSKSQGTSDDSNSVKLEPGEDEPQPLTEEETQEKTALLNEGFSNWNRRDFNAFVRACEKWGRLDLSKICLEVEGKSEDEVTHYSQVFWKRYQELNDWERILKNIEKGEQKIQRHQDISTALHSKVSRYRNPWNELKIYYGANKGKAYTEEEDRFIVCMTNNIGYGNWDQLKAEIRKSWRFRFDWFIKSRTPQELSRRCDTLIRLIEKENEELEMDEKSKRTTSKRSAPSKSADSSGLGKKRRTTATPAGNNT